MPTGARSIAFLARLERGLERLDTREALRVHLRLACAGDQRTRTRDVSFDVPEHFRIAEAEIDPAVERTNDAAHVSNDAPKIEPRLAVERDHDAHLLAVARRRVGANADTVTAEIADRDLLTTRAVEQESPALHLDPRPPPTLVLDPHRTSHHRRRDERTAMGDNVPRGHPVPFLLKQA
jgi:hypothetical protein